MIEKTRVNLPLFAFIIVAFGELIAHWFDMRTLHIICKPLLMPSLLWFFMMNLRNKDHQVQYPIIFSLCFSWLGDVFLLFQTPDNMFFIFGLSAFLTAHVLYIFAYNRAVSAESEYKMPVFLKGIGILSFVIIGCYLLYVLYPGLGSMKLPVGIYAVTIVFMGVVALRRYKRTSPSSFLLVLIGAIIFMASDSMIALDKFVSTFWQSDFWIMFTYILAQFLIIKGLLMHYAKT